MRILVLILSLFGYVFLHAQIAFNIATHIDENQAFEGLNDIEWLENDNFIISGRYIDDDAPIDGDSMYIAMLNRYGELLWKNKKAELPENIPLAGHYSHGFTNVEDSLLFAIEGITTSLIQPEYEFWRWKSYIHVFDLEGQFLNTISPQASFPAYRFDEIVYHDEKLFLLGTGISNEANEGLYDWIFIATDLEGNTIAEFSLPEADLLHQAGQILVLSDGRIIISSKNLNANNDFVSTGIHCISPDLEEILWSETIEGSVALSMTENLEGNILIGSAEIANLGFDLFFHAQLLEIDSENGDLLWSASYHDEENSSEYIYGVHQKEDGSIYFGGYERENFTDYREAFLTKLDADKEIEWHKNYKCFEEQEEEYIRDMVATPDGGFLLGGWSRGIDEEQEEIWLIKTDSLGNDSIPIGAYFVQDTLFLNHGESRKMNPIPYGGSNSYIHQWTGNTVYLDETQTWYPTFTGSQAGTFTLTYTATDAVDGNEAMAQIVVVVYPADALTELNPDNWQFYPNPATDQIQINTDYKGESLLEIYAMDGRLLKQALIQGNETINLQGLPSGLLSMQVSTDDGMLLHKARVLKR